MDGPPTFAADAMLGKLARWLRLLGYDCFYERDIDDARLIELCRREGRILLTRDRRVASKSPRALFVPPGNLDAELLTVYRAIGGTPPDEPPTTRCSLCNALLVAVAPSSLAEGAVPERVRTDHGEVWRCPACARVYWRGTHVESMAERLARLRARLAEGGVVAPRG